MTKPIYLDYAAATPVDSEVLAAMEPYWRDQFYNPSANYLSGRSIRQALEGARGQVAQSLGCRPAEIVFTAGATEANNLAIAGIMRRFPDAEVLVSAIEHESVLAPAEQFDCHQIPVTPQGIVDLAELEKMISDKTVLVSVMLINNELGTIQPLKEIRQLLNLLSNLRLSKGNKLPLYLHTDAAQAPNYLDLHVARLGADILSLNGGKIYGPKQSGALYIKAGVKLKPLILGGGQEFGLRSGTENVAADIGLAVALAKAQAGKSLQVKKINDLRLMFEERLTNLAPNIQINGASKYRAPHISSITFPGVDNERLMMQLDEAGIMAAVGSACSASSDEPSHVLAAIGLSVSAIRSTLRFSFGQGLTVKDIECTLDTLKNLF